MPDVLEFDVPEPTERSKRASRVYESASGKQPVKDRVSVPIAEDGSIDVGAMRDDSRARFEKAINHPKSKAQFFPESAELEFSDDDIAAIFNTITGIEALMARMLLKAPPAVAVQAFTWTPEQIAVISPATKAVLQRYLPVSIQKHKDLTVFLMVFLNVTRAQFANCIRVTLELRKMEQEKIKANGRNIVEVTQ